VGPKTCPPEHEAPGSLECSRPPNAVSSSWKKLFPKVSTPGRNYFQKSVTAKKRLFKLLEDRVTVKNSIFLKKKVKKFSALNLAHVIRRVTVKNSIFLYLAYSCLSLSRRTF
jgi:hypothetical protein